MKKRRDPKDLPFRRSDYSGGLLRDGPSEPRGGRAHDYADELNGAAHEDADLAAMNAEFAVVKIGGKTRVVSMAESKQTQLVI